MKRKRRTEGERERVSKGERLFNAHVAIDAFYVYILCVYFEHSFSGKNTMVTQISGSKTLGFL